MTQFFNFLSENRFVKRIAQTYKSYVSLGFVGFFKNSLCVKYEIVLMEKNLNDISPYSSRNTLQVCALDKQQQKEILEFYETIENQVVDPDLLLERYFANECQCFVARRKGRIIGYFWWGDRKTKFENSVPALSYFRNKFDLNDMDAVGVDFFVFPTERGGGAALEFYAKVCVELNRIGYNRLLGSVMKENRAARWTYDLLGHVQLKKIIVYRLLNHINFFRSLKNSAD